MVVGVVFCYKDFSVPSTIRRKLKDYNKSGLRKLVPNPQPNDVIRKNNFFYTVLDDVYKSPTLSYEAFVRLFTAVRDYFLENKEIKEKIKVIVMPLDILVGRGYELEEIVILIDQIFSETGIQIKV